MPRPKSQSSHSSKLTTKLKLQPSQLAVAFRHIKPTWKHYLDYVESAAREGDKDMEKFLGAYYGLTRREQAVIMPEQMCELCGIKTEALFGAVCTQLWRASRMEANLITAINFPRVIEKTAKAALGKNGVKDREMFHKATGFIKTPTGPSVVVNNNPQTAIVNGKTEMRALPSMEEEALLMEEAIHIPLLEAPKEAVDVIDEV